MKRKVYLNIFGQIYTKTEDGVTENKIIKLELLDTNASSAIKEFRKKLKETVQSFKDNNKKLMVDEPINYVGPVLLEGKFVKDFLFLNLNQSLLEKYSRSKSQFTIGDTVLDERLSIKQLSDTYSFKGRNLWGFEEYDMDGVKPEAILLVDCGILKNKLRGRLSYDGNAHSTGNERIGGNFTSVNS